MYYKAYFYEYGQLKKLFLDSKSTRFNTIEETEERINGVIKKYLQIVIVEVIDKYKSKIVKIL